MGINNRQTGNVKGYRPVRTDSNGPFHDDPMTYQHATHIFVGINISGRNIAESAHLYIKLKLARKKAK